MYLLDTDALSLTSPESRLTDGGSERWRGWTRRNQDRLFLSVVTIMEVRFGIERLRRKAATRKADALAKWLLIAETIYRDRIVWISPEIAHRAGHMLAQAERSGAAPGSEDALIAASAAVSGFRLISRNGRHMNALGADWLNPLDALPD